MSRTKFTPNPNLSEILSLVSETKQTNRRLVGNNQVIIVFRASNGLLCVSAQQYKCATITA